MLKSAMTAIVSATAFLVLWTATPAQAQATRTWVSGVGDDAIINGMATDVVNLHGLFLQGAVPASLRRAKFQRRYGCLSNVAA